MQVVLKLKGSEQHRLAFALWLTLNTADLPMLPLWAKISPLMSVSIPIPTRIRNRCHINTFITEHFMPEG
jgi:hypothetical protein